MASINTIVKRKQYLWLGIVVVGTASAIGGALYLSDVDMSGNGETVAEQEPVPDMTGVVDTTFDDKVRQHATTEMQVTAAQMQKQYEEIRRELDVLNKQRGDDQRRIEKLGQDNAALAEQVKALGANPVTATGEPVPQMPASPPGPEGEPQPGNTPVSFPPQGSVAVPPPTAFYPGNGVTPPPQVTYQSVPVPNRIQRKVFICHYRAADAADYVRETDRSLMQLVTALWATLALMYVSLAAITGKYPVRPGKMKCIRVVTADEHLKEVYTEDASLPGKIRKCPVYLPDDRTNRNNGDKNEHA
ncbi:conjugal transfer protein TraP [Escherichia coli]|uniref:conjugal transfer pilus-stabilizing protein TraP n=1 Tax=Escherichia coli TaxID=562 RepID=UPI0012FD8D70|nr:conjugal transfer pilus-stabilizing protein TraP [Escherichia coli]EGL8659721.1 conjugal transfer protein TraP [Escherichia coli]EGL8746905.1 conjugal transfer protein TraP [Escherichia coli]KAE9885043.1 conjugal transfer protein TraP [Escherichia coli]MVV79136.1 conjugal transfer protein TraP [Escherichia coli]